MRHRIDNSCAIEDSSQYLENITGKEVSMVQTTFIDREHLENLATWRFSQMLLMYRSLEDDRYKFKFFWSKSIKRHTRDGKFLNFSGLSIGLDSVNGTGRIHGEF